VARSDQLDRIGYGPDARRRAHRAGTIEPITRRIWHLSAAPFTAFGKLMTLVLIAGRGAALSHGTSGQLFGLRRMPDEKPCICVPGDRRITVPDWAQVRYTNWPDPDPWTRLDGLVTTSPLRTAFDLGAVLGDWAFESAAEQFWHKGLVTPETCARFIEGVRRSGRRGVSKNVAWLEGALTRERPAQSGLEVDLARSLEAAGLPTLDRQIELLLPTLGLVHVDVGWKALRLGLEPGHTEFHAAPEDIRYDTTRDDEAASLGWVIKRYSERHLADMNRCVREITAIYRDREAARRLGVL
jgi:hypothetical protein